MGADPNTEKDARWDALADAGSDPLAHANSPMDMDADPDALLGADTGTGSHVDLHTEPDSGPDATSHADMDAEADDEDEDGPVTKAQGSRATKGKRRDIIYSTDTDEDSVDKPSSPIFPASEQQTTTGSRRKTLDAVDPTDSDAESELSSVASADLEADRIPDTIVAARTESTLRFRRKDPTVSITAELDPDHDVIEIRGKKPDDWLWITFKNVFDRDNPPVRPATPLYNERTGRAIRSSASKARYKE